MKTILLALLVIVSAFPAQAWQVATQTAPPDSSAAIADSIVLGHDSTTDLSALVRELIMNNQVIERAAVQMDIADARVPQAGALDPPQLRFMQEGMPEFKWGEAMYSRLELMQMIPFPGKTGTRSSLARVRAGHAHHDHLEVINAEIARLKMAYAELWFSQQSQALDRSNLRLMEIFIASAEARYKNGLASQTEPLQARVERSMLANTLVDSRRNELAAKAMIVGMLDREPGDTIGYAVIPESVVFTVSLDSLLAEAAVKRPMIMHDSAMIEEGELMRRMAKQEYLPDFTFGIERMTSPMGAIPGGGGLWSVSAGITLPFMPWSAGKISGQADEAESVIDQARASYRASRAMVTGNIREMYYKADAAGKKLENFQREILPAANQGLEAALAGYRNGTVSFPMLIDSYRKRTDLNKEYFMTRMEFDQAVADLEREVGVMNIASN